MQTFRDLQFAVRMLRLKAGIALEQARADMSMIMQRLAHEYPENNTDLGARVETLKDQFVGEVRRGLLILLVAVGCVLLIACANVANLLLSGAVGRTREIAVRAALGAGRLRVARQLITENLLLAGVGGLLGAVLAWWSFEFLKQLVPPDLPRGVLAFDSRVLWFTLLATVFTALLFGLAPLLQAVRVDLNEALKEGGARGGSGSRNRIRNLLAVSEVALSVILLASAVLLLRSFGKLRGVDPGFRSESVLTLRLDLSRSKYPDGPTAS